MSQAGNALCVGVMSGTSVDGIDVAVVEIGGEHPQMSVKLRYFQTVPFDERVREGIFRLFNPTASTVVDVSNMNFLLGEVFADAVVNTVAQAGVDMRDILLVSSHGQTVYHSPDAVAVCGVPTRSTLQIGEAAVIAERTGRPVVSDFRVRDLAAGGQGAPLVPFVDRMLFGQSDSDTIAANIGGIANLTVVPGKSSSQLVLAFDTGPGNMLIDGLVRKATDGRQRYDVDGKLAKQGRIQEDYLQRWLNLPYFAQSVPKSTGRELFGEQCVAQWWADSQSYGFSTGDLIATATEFTVRTFTDAVKNFVLPDYNVASIVVGGGGSYNPAIMDGIQRYLQDLRVLPQESTHIPGDAKEAVAFAVLGYECFRQRPNNVPSATGAHHPVVMGKISWA